ncbi:redoxin domain-containing protein [Parapedobacter deserti]|uniref:Redoxin domain-containing protein n=1 Tax=Parapedobacter deserti TaxID=1912957 RepID=A0ABV7JQ23_9SPHI
MNAQITLLVGLFLSFGSAQAQRIAPLQLKGNVQGAKNGQIYLQRFDNKIFHTIDSATLKNGDFAFQTAVQLPELYGLTLEKDKTPFYIFLEDAPISVALDTGAYYRNTTVTGSKSHDRFVDYSSRQRNIQIADFIKEDPASITTAYVLYRYFAYRLSPPQIREYTSLLDASLQNSQYVTILHGLANTLETVLPGNKAPDFTSTAPDGSTVRFSDYLGNGYVLLDFWAAWCGPCRRENPNVVAAYQQYKNKGFNVFGVSLDKTREAWVKAIEADGLTWPQVSDITFWNSKAAALYGVRSIPSNFLIGPDGTIVARNLRGEELHDKLAELIDKK